MKAIIIKKDGKRMGWFGSDSTTKEDLEKECLIATRALYAATDPFSHTWTAEVGNLVEHVDYDDTI